MLEDMAICQLVTYRRTMTWGKSAILLKITSCAYLAGFVTHLVGVHLAWNNFFQDETILSMSLAIAQTNLAWV